MGMFDEVHVDDDVLNGFNMKCSCGSSDRRDYFQTKDLECCLFHYWLKYDEYGTLCLFQLYEPMDKNNPLFWHTYTEEEIKELKEEKRTFLAFMNEHRISEGGYWLPEAYRPENRKAVLVGHLHQHVSIYDQCYKCKAWREFDLKFTDGQLMSITKVEEKE